MNTPPNHSIAPEPPRKVPLRERIEPIFFNPTLKLAALRMALLASASVLGCAIAFFGVRSLGASVYIVTLPIIFLHHFLSAFKLRYMVRLADLILLIAEITLLILFNGSFHPNRYSSTSLIVFFVAVWTLVTVLFYLLLCRIAAIIRHKGRNLLSGFDLLEDSLRLKNIPIHGLPAAYSMLAGRSIWNTQFAGESMAVRLIRGFVAAVFIATLLGYGVLSLAVKPVQETAVTPVKESRGPAVPFDEIKDADGQTWNIVFAIPIVNFNDSKILRQAVSVTPLWEEVQTGDENPPCEDTGLQLIGNNNDDFDYQIVHISCPPRAPRADDTLLLSDVLPDILIEVDYSALSIPPNVMRGMRGNSVAIYVGYTTNIDILMANSRAIPLPPASHYLADVNAGNLRKVLKHPALSGLGMFESTQTYWTAEVNSIVLDPLTFTNPPVYNTSSGVSTFRLFASHDTSDIRILEDSREQSVLGGLSALGGLWTILGGIFAIFFGTTLMRIFFGSKSLSIFGIAQQMEKANIVEAYLREYPQIRQELALPQHQRGLMTLLQDHMIDVALFQEAIDEAKAPISLPLSSHDVENPGSGAGTPNIEKADNLASR